MKPHLYKILILGILGLLLSMQTHAQTTTSCPNGYYPSTGACIANNISSATRDIPPGNSCPVGFERVPGVRFCVASNLVLEIQNNLILLSSKSSNTCPSGFSQAVGSTICTANNLVLKVIDNEVRLTAYSGNCPAGWYRPIGTRFCIPNNIVGVLPTPTSIDCPPGFIKPPGVHFCIASNMLQTSNTWRNNLPSPVGKCPKGWYRPENVNFCIPSHESSGYLKPVTAIGGPALTCPAGTVEIWWDMPIYDNNGLFVIGHVPTRTCIPEDLEPAG